ncbi:MULTISPECIES: Holliday junction resolvase RuvX [Dethiosulfovibrio]|uniref:Putative pre-16S rRNA nuclease n=2 Tax=Dethiosulfovibrio TaxID=47054 RepID=A0ABS9EQ45_9BACT|nr:MULTISPECIES: Holliday junction resolvase RuvX [Dethiosulfovibrio]MCF4113555.1 Holliday junction resolvase RuvX [Dethiosulfovibrio russensis]MCF4142025.1 Holliday junction resolvase RuvX [Dethiosulfovibrio marinus]MCF4144180.1 Holliday junction resolvase RuvX [Dethiosulfovibrio acidaminovorans]
MTRRIVALDMGTVRIGVAMSDPLGSFAQGVAVWDAEGDWLSDLRELVTCRNVSTVVVGLPIRENGTKGPSAENVEAKTEAVREAFPDLEIVMWDERYTSTIANRVLIEGDVSRKKRKGQVDKVAATVILQGYLDSLRR